MSIFVKFTKTTHQIWSCHVTVASNSESVYLLPNSILNFRKSYQIWGKMAQEQKSYRQKTNWRVEKTPVLMGLTAIFSLFKLGVPFLGQGASCSIVLS